MRCWLDRRQLGHLKCFCFLMMCLSHPWFGDITLPGRNWTSTTPESFGHALSGWDWMKEWHALAPARRHVNRIRKGRLSQLLSPRCLLVDPSSGNVSLCLHTLKWGALVCSVDVVPDLGHVGGADYWKVYVPRARSISWLHCVDPEKWKVIPYEDQQFLPSSHDHYHHPQHHHSRIIIIIVILVASSCGRW